MRTLAPLCLLALIGCDPAVDFPALDDTGDPDTDTDTDTDPVDPDGWDSARPSSDFAWSEVGRSSIEPFGGPPVNLVSQMVSDGDVVIGLSSASIYISDDAGHSWRRSDPGHGFTYGRTLALDGDDLYLGAFDGLWHSTDLGETWEHLSNETEDGRGLYDIQAAGGRVLGSMGGSLPHLLEDGVWTPVVPPNANAQIHLTDTGLVAVIPFVDMMWSTPDDGTTWELLAETGVGFLDHVDDDLIIGRSGVSGMLRRSDDGGTTWTDLATIGLYETVRYHEGVYYVGSNGEGLRTSTDGLTFVDASAGLPNGDASSLFDLVVLDDGDLVTTTFAPYGVYAADAGSAFERVTDGLDGGAPYGVDRHGDALVASFAQQGLWQRDASGSWTELTPAGALSTESFGAVASNGSVLAVATGRAGMLTSTDGGASWHDDGGRLPIYNGSAGNQSVGFPDLTSRGTWFFAATNLAWEGSSKGGSKIPVGGGASLAMDGTSWEWATWGMPMYGTNQWGDPVYARGTAIAAMPDRVLLGTTEFGVYVSEDRGETWETSTGIPSDTSVLALASVDDLWLAATPTSLYVSDNGGYRWSPLNDGLPADFRALDVISADETAFLLVEGDGGLYRLDDGRWNQVAAAPAGVTLRAPLYQQDDLFLVSTASRGFFQVVP